MLYLSLILFATSSLILCVYRDTAIQRGYQIGTFFLSGKARGQGWAGLICAAIFSLWKTDFWGLLIVASISFLLALPAILAWFREKSQIIAIIGFWIGFILSLVSK